MTPRKLEGDVHGRRRAVGEGSEAGRGLAQHVLTVPAAGHIGTAAGPVFSAGDSRYVATPAGGVAERPAALTAPPSAENRPSTEK